MNRRAMNKREIIEQLSLVEHVEGGYFSETYRSADVMGTNREGSERAVMTSIYYLLTNDRPIDHLHQNQSDIMRFGRELEESKAGNGDRTGRSASATGAQRLLESRRFRSR